MSRKIIISILIIILIAIIAFIISKDSDENRPNIYVEAENNLQLEEYKVYNKETGKLEPVYTEMQPFEEEIIENLAEN